MPAGHAAPGADRALRTGRRRALPGPRASALGAWPGWSLSRWRL